MMSQPVLEEQDYNPRGHASEAADGFASDLEEQRVFYQALDSFQQYGKVAHFNTTHLRRQSFYALPRAHWELLAAPPFSYLKTLDSVDEAIDKNAELANAIYTAGLDFYSSTCDQPESERADEQPPIGKSPQNTEKCLGMAKSSDLEKARSTIRQFFRDWSQEGTKEREASYGPILRALADERVLRDRKNLNVLVPGAGLGRLVFELCAAGFDVEGNEISYHSMLASSYILNHCRKANAHILFPWVHSFSNHKSRTNQLMSVQIPDVQPSLELGKLEASGQAPGMMSMSASDFLCLYGQEDQRDRFDAVATVFFLDTAPNIIRYIEVIYNCLKPGGILINNGPLLWHFENNAPGAHGRSETDTYDQETQGIADPGSVELTDDEVIALVQRLGFEIEYGESGIAAPYIQDSQSMLQNTYQSSHWIARKSLLKSS